MDSARTTAKSVRTAVFRAGEKIARYTGKLLTKKQLDKLYPGKDELAPYAVAAGRVDGKQMYIDGASWKSSVARYANDGCGPKGYGKGASDRAVAGVSTHCKRTNAYLKGGKGKVWLVALKNLYDGDEIYTEYGPEYWRGGGSSVKALAKAAARAKPAAKPAEFSKKLAVRRGYANELEVLLSVYGKKHLQQVVKRKSGAGRIVTKDAGVAVSLVPRATLFKERKLIEKHLRSALRALHKAGWRHHDLYPRNVTRTVDPRSGKPVYTLIDYDKMKRATKSSHVTEDVQTLLSRMKIQ